MLRVSLRGDIFHSAEREANDSWPRGYVARIVPGAGAPPYLIDLTEFAEGREVVPGTVSVRERFRGRPRLARQLTEAFQSRYWPANKSSAQAVTSDLRAFFRFLDSCDDG